MRKRRQTESPHPSTTLFWTPLPTPRTDNRTDERVERDVRHLRFETRETQSQTPSLPLGVRV